MVTRFDDKRWCIKVDTPSRMDIIKYAVNNYEWQKFRLSLKGTSTYTKLQQCDQWINMAQDKFVAYVQVNNYLGALKRGGQIAADGSILK